MKIEDLQKIAPQAIGTLLLLGAYYPANPYGYYQILRIATFGITLYLLWKNLESQSWLKASLAATAVVYNPILPITFSRHTWEYINATTIVLLVLSGIISILPRGNKSTPAIKAPGTLSPIEVADEPLETLQAYKSAIESYISWAGLFAELLIARAVDDVFGRAEELATTSLFKEKTHYKVAGALIIDALAKYRSDKEMGLKYLLALVATEDAEKIIADADDGSYHENLDVAVHAVIREIEAKGLFVPLRGNGMPLEVQAEVVVYLACYVAMLESGKNMSSMAWNSFKRSVENRILSIDPESEPTNGYVESGGTKRFVQYTSKYWPILSRLEDLVLKSKTAPNQYSYDEVLQQIYISLGNDGDAQLDELTEIFEMVKNTSAKEAVPKVVKSFS